MSGLLSLASDPVFNAGVGLLAGNVESRNPVSPFASMQNSLAQGAQARQQLNNQQMIQIRLQQQQERLNQEKLRYDNEQDLLTQEKTKEEAFINSLPPDQQAAARVNLGAFAKPVTPTGLPSAVQEYQYAKTQGFTGSFEDWKVGMANAKATKVDINNPSNFPYEVPKGFMPVDVNDPNKGVTPIPGSDKDEVTPEQAAKIQMLKTAQDAYTEVKDLIYDDQGDIDRENLFNAKVGMPFSEGRDLGVRMETGIQAITRAETGAAMPDTEVDNTKKRFMPSPLDSEKTIKLKLELYEDFISGSLDLIDPSGRFKESAFEEELKKRKTQRVTPKNASVDDLVNKYAN